MMIMREKSFIDFDVRKNVGAIIIRVVNKRKEENETSCGG
jgi:hypothetical protein